MTAPKRQPTIRVQQPRPKPAAQAGAARADAQSRPHHFSLPQVREIPRRAVAGPWESGW